MKIIVNGYHKFSIASQYFNNQTREEKKFANRRCQTKNVNPPSKKPLADTKITRFEKLFLDVPFYTDKVCNRSLYRRSVVLY